MVYIYEAVVTVNSTQGVMGSKRMIKYFFPDKELGWYISGWKKLEEKQYSEIGCSAYRHQSIG